MPIKAKGSCGSICSAWLRQLSITHIRRIAELCVCDSQISECHLARIAIICALKDAARVCDGAGKVLVAQFIVGEVADLFYWVPMELLRLGVFRDSFFVPVFLSELSSQIGVRHEVAVGDAKRISP